nr:hypothetical protein [uncultured Mediterranean phage uvMED]
MANKALRLQYPYPPSGSDYSQTLYWPNIPWQDSDSSDCPTVSQIMKITESTLTRSVKSIADGSTYSLNANTSFATYTPSNGNNFWQRNPSQRPTLSGTSNPMAMIIGHKGVQSANSELKSWQRSVVGFSMEHKDTPYSGMYGHYIDECTLLYRKWSDNSRFYGVDLIYGGNLMNDCKKNYANQSPFKTNNPRRNGTQGGFYMAMDENNLAHAEVTSPSGGYVFQGIYMNWGSYDGNSQFVAKLELWNLRLIFKTNRVSDDGHRICLPRMWSFQDAGTSKNLKLTYT